MGPHRGSCAAIRPAGRADRRSNRRAGRGPPKAGSCSWASQQAHLCAPLSGKSRRDLARVEGPGKTAPGTMRRSGGRGRRHQVAGAFVALLQRFGAKRAASRRASRRVRHREPRFPVRAPREGPGDVRERSLPLEGRKQPQAAARPSPPPRRALRRSKTAPPAPSAAPATTARRERRRFLEHQVRVGSAESE